MLAIDESDKTVATILITSVILMMIAIVLIINVTI